jgi:hypothetical protein
MDDILASIRKIISDDEARAQVNSQQAASQAGRPGAVPPFEMRADPKARPAGDDVLMLTDLIEEPKPGDAPPPIRCRALHLVWKEFDDTKAVVRWQVSHTTARGSGPTPAPSPTPRMPPTIRYSSPTVRAST